VSRDEEPVTINEAEDFLRIDSSQTALVAMLVSAVRQEAEKITRRLLVRREAEAEWDQFYERADLPRPPIASVSSVESYDLKAEQWQAVDATDYDRRGRELRLESGNGGQPLRVTYTAGYGTVPRPLKLQLLRDVRYAYDHRDPGADGSARVQDQMAYQQYRPY
jgi:uncharacterized phiE125 gp8 family phage protein